MKTLVIGGARSGKSRIAEGLLAQAPDVTYVATGYPAHDDPEWAARIARHVADRPATWTTVETLDLAGLLRADGGPLLVDCLTLWLTRVMDEVEAWTTGASVDGPTDELLGALRESARDVVLVTNEVGQGVVPESASGRLFRDEMGRLNAAVAAECGDLLWCVAGRVVRL
ncbi:MAG TPA: bifunctional adenosylcobinamide kinase/adenosylcobinamide-phosphate guanylyltransferase [Nocardioides sp.]